MLAYMFYITHNEYCVSAHLFYCIAPFKCLLRAKFQRLTVWRHACHQLIAVQSFPLICQQHMFSANAQHRPLNITWRATSSCQFAQHCTVRLAHGMMAMMLVMLHITTVFYSKYFCENPIVLL